MLMTAGAREWRAAERGRKVVACREEMVGWEGSEERVARCGVTQDATRNRAAKSLRVGGVSSEGTCMSRAKQKRDSLDAVDAAAQAQPPHSRTARSALAPLLLHIEAEGRIPACTRRRSAVRGCPDCGVRGPACARSGGLPFAARARATEKKTARQGECRRRRARCASTTRAFVGRSC